MNRNPTSQTPLVSVVSPVYRGAAMVGELVARCRAALEEVAGDRWEIVLVNDASPDASWEAIARECAAEPRVKGVDLARNFGQHYAITAGLKHVSGEWVVVMDCDLQDRPEDIPALWRKAREGFDVVCARRATRQDGTFKRVRSAVFHRLYAWLSGLSTEEGVANFGIYSRQVVEAYNRMPERARSFPTLVACLGFRRATVDVEQDPRAEGKSGYTLAKLLKLALDVIVSNSNRPLQLAVGLGFAMSAVSFLLALWNLVAKWAGVIRLEGFTTTVFSIWFVGGLLLLVMGVQGLYVGKIFDQVKGRPLFIVRETRNLGPRGAGGADEEA